jgi:hypothetical protein
MVQPDQFEAFYAAHPSVPKTVVRKIYEWKVSRDPDIFPLYYDRSLALGVRVLEAPESAAVPAVRSPPSAFDHSRLMGSARMMPAIRKQEPIILTVRNRSTRPV